MRTYRYLYSNLYVQIRAYTCLHIPADTFGHQYIQIQTYIYTYRHVHTYCIHPCRYLWVPIPTYTHRYIRIHADRQLQIPIHRITHRFILTYTFLQILLDIFRYLYTYIYMQVRTYTFLYIHIHTYICLYRYLYLFIHTGMQAYIHHMHAGRRGRGCETEEQPTTTQKGMWVQSTTKQLHW